MTAPLLSLQSVSVDYVTAAGDARAVNRVSLDIHPGETFGLAGESGCGKSTLAFAITRMHTPPALVTEGRILFQGRDVLAMTDAELRAFRWNQVSMVFQSAMNALNPVITIGEQLTDVILAHRRVRHDEAWARGEALLEQVGIARGRMASYPHQLSGGMRQRVVIAISLALEPKLIVMDEPTTALDVVVEREIMDELAVLKREHGFATLFISHDLGLMGEICDRIGIMYAGNLVETGTAAQVLDDPRHPYTQGLVGSFPTIHGPKTRLTGIPGSPVNLLKLPQGCNFQARCPARFAPCDRVEPALAAVPGCPGHRAACHLLTQAREDAA
ncbi:ABC transporter ATP-binding protein [Paracoccus aestuarii]|uniref:ABC transporter ATP-binding protein n=1 Tax=Paracoccus aestuarii TaxID=453842 RepID=A0A419A074_9RHOB|nr:ABC transporter ATP-binding protein [Paracoccus aestuarii]RJL06198.1 ABC transporter ATP-binding protein [Paracoccus aestuarii]WCQ98314.1 ABC transporter ATP-binding protein [Paracoccus aestuarii]